MVGDRENQRPSRNIMRRVLHGATGVMPDRKFLDEVMEDKGELAQRWGLNEAELAPILEQMSEDYKALMTLRNAPEFSTNPELFQQRLLAARAKFTGLVAALNAQKRKNERR